MIPQAYITEWSAQVPWQTNEQVEQDLVICRALVEIFSHKFLAERLAFRGGTALHKLYLDPQPRYSEDIDLVQITNEPFGPVIDALRGKLSFLGAATLKQKENNNTLIFRFESEFPPIQKLRLKVETNCREHFSVLGLVKFPFNVESSWFKGSCEITTYRLEELLGTKLRALYQRRKGRDLYDLHKAFTSKDKLNITHLIKCYLEYMHFSVGSSPSQKEFIDNMELKMKDNEFIGDITALLRPTEKYDQNVAYADKATAQSVLLAVFQNESQFITLAQARWFSGGELKRIFILSHKKLSISNDFSPFDSAGDWRKKLKQKYPKQGTKELIFFIDSPGEYGRLMRKQLGMKTEKAHTLFSQTIGLKVLGNLDEFVRFQMLEEKDAESEFQKIKDHFKTLNDAHKAIEKSHQQIEMLNPIRDKSIKITAYTSDLLSLESNQSAAPIWLADRQKQLIINYLEKEESEKSKTEATAANLEQEVSDLDGKRIKLEVQIETDEVGRQIGDLEKEIKRLEREKNDRETELKHYNELASELEFQENPSSSPIFEDQRVAAIDRKKKALELYNKNDAERLEAYVLKQGLDKEFTILTNQLSALRSQKNNITGRVAEIRKEILEHVGATEKEIQFIGELLKVKDDSKHWEPAIELLLHSLALRIIVPDEYYQQVSRYVNDNDLKGRIVYHRFNKKDVAPLIFRESNTKELFDKLEFKASPYKEWVESEIRTKHNYICTDAQNNFLICLKNSFTF